MSISTSTGMKYADLPANLGAAVDAAFAILPMAGHRFLWGTYFPDAFWLTTYDWNFKDHAAHSTAAEGYGLISEPLGHEAEVYW